MDTSQDTTAIKKEPSANTKKAKAEQAPTMEPGSSEDLMASLDRAAAEDLDRAEEAQKAAKFAQSTKEGGAARGRAQLRKETELEQDNAVKRAAEAAGAAAKQALEDKLPARTKAAILNMAEDKRKEVENQARDLAKRQLGTRLAREVESGKGALVEVGFGKERAAAALLAVNGRLMVVVPHTNLSNEGLAMMEYQLDRTDVTPNRVVVADENPEDKEAMLICFSVEGGVTEFRPGAGNSLNPGLGFAWQGGRVSVSVDRCPGRSGREGEAFYDSVFRIIRNAAQEVKGAPTGAPLKGEAKITVASTGGSDTRPQNRLND
jgi:hypothetical protein